MDAYRDGRRVAVPTFAGVGRRWPVFTPRALGAGMAGVCAFRCGYELTGSAP